MPEEREEPTRGHPWEPSRPLGLVWSHTPDVAATRVTTGSAARGADVQNPLAARRGGCTTRHWPWPRRGSMGGHSCPGRCHWGVPTCIQHFGSERGQKPPEWLRPGRRTPCPAPCHPQPWLPAHGAWHPALAQPGHRRARLMGPLRGSSPSAPEQWFGIRQAKPPRAHGIPGCRPRSLSCSIRVQHPRVSQSPLEGLRPLQSHLWGHLAPSVGAAGPGLAHSWREALRHCGQRGLCPVSMCLFLGWERAQSGALLPGPGSCKGEGTRRARGVKGGCASTGSSVQTWLPQV